MSRISRFKWQRAVPGPGTAGNPAFGLFSLKPLRQLPSFLGTATAGGGQTDVAGCIVPANSWGLNKLVMLRVILQRTFPSGAPVAGYDIEEWAAISQATPAILPRPAAFTASTGIFTTERYLQFIRFDPYILALDLADCFNNGWMNDQTSAYHVISVPATSPPFDFTQDITLSLQELLTSSFPGATVQGLWAEAFIEQAANLGALS